MWYEISSVVVVIASRILGVSRACEVSISVAPIANGIGIPTSVENCSFVNEKYMMVALSKICSRL